MKAHKSLGDEIQRISAILHVAPGEGEERLLPTGNEQVERGFKPTTINRHLGTVVSLYRFMGLSCPVRSRRHRLREPQRLAGCLKTLIGQPPERMLAWLFPFQKDGERQQFCFEHRKSTLGRLNQNAYPIRIEFIGINIANKMTKAALLIQDFPCFR